MATLQGTFSSNNYKGVRVEAYEVANSGNVINNTSVVRVDMYVYSINYSGSAWGNVNAEVWLAGQYKTIPVSSWSLSGSSEKYIGSVEFIVRHEEDGSKLCSFGFSYYPGGDLGGFSGETSFPISTIPRASSVGCSDFYIESSTNIVINSASNNFTHTLKYAFGNLSGTIVEKTKQTVYAWTPNASNFYQQIKNVQQKVGTITCETYNGVTLIGTKTCNFTARVDVSKNKPNVVLSVIDVNETTKALTGNENILVKYFSNAKATIIASAKNYATIKSYQINNASAEQVTTINNVETNKFIAKVVDSRDIDNVSEEVIVDFIDYVKLAFKNILVERIGPTTDQVRLDLEGFYFDKNFGAVSNELIVKVRYKEEYGEWSEYKNITPTVEENNTFSLLNYNLNTLFDNVSFNYQKSYSFQFYANDKLVIIDQTLSLKRGLPLVAYGEDFIHIYGDLEVDGKYIDLFPIGSIYMSVNATNPNNYFGGTWEQIAQGRTLVGVDTSQTEFNIAEKMGGEKEHILTAQEMPSHNHGLDFSIVTYGQNGTIVGENGMGNTVRGYYIYAKSNGGNKPHNNLQPYFTCYIWQRIA